MINEKELIGIDGNYNSKIIKLKSGLADCENNIDRYKNKENLEYVLQLLNYKTSFKIQNSSSSSDMVQRLSRSV